MWRVLLLFLAGTASAPVLAYPAKLDAGNLRQGTLRIASTSDKPAQCSVTVLSDKAYFQLTGTGDQQLLRVPVRYNLQLHEFSLHCKPIARVTRDGVWRYNTKYSPTQMDRIFY
tara:strand:- start:4017 stop:4358 length:342 start_codon:yes stop_codon:yes gene_type:complete